MSSVTSISEAGPQKVYSHPETNPKVESKKKKCCGCWPSKEKRHSRQLTEHEIAYTVMVRAERAAKKAFEEKGNG